MQSRAGIWKKTIQTNRRENESSLVQLGWHSAPYKLRVSVQLQWFSRCGEGRPSGFLPNSIVEHVTQVSKEAIQLISWSFIQKVCAQRFPPTLVCMTTLKSSFMKKGLYWSLFSHFPYGEFATKATQGLQSLWFPSQQPNKSFLASEGFFQ